MLSEFQPLTQLSCYEEMIEEDVKAKRLVFDDALNGCGKRETTQKYRGCLLILQPCTPIASTCGPELQ